MIDLFTSRRTNYLKCKWFEQFENEDYVKLNELVHSKTPAGYFYAKEVNSYSMDNQQVENLWMAPSKRVTLTTNDNVTKLRQNDIVIFRNEVWRVESKQPSPKNTQRQYRVDSRLSATTIISLKK